MECTDEFRKSKDINETYTTKIKIIEDFIVENVVIYNHHQKNQTQSTKELSKKLFLLTYQITKFLF